MADPNWFYSTLAQSTAAIVGLGGAFLVQRILQQRNEIAEPRSVVREQTIDAYTYVLGARTNADQIAQSLASAADEGRVRIDAGFQSFQPTVDLYAYESGSGMTGRANGLPVELEPLWIEKFADASRAAADLRDALPSSLEAYVAMVKKRGSLDASRIPWIEADPAPDVQAQGMGDPFLTYVDSQRDQLGRLWAHMDKAVTENGTAIREFSNRLVFRLLGVLTALLVVGTIVPMLYLSARSDCSRLLLLIPFAVLSLAFFGFVANELRELRSAGDFSKESF